MNLQSTARNGRLSALPAPSRPHIVHLVGTLGAGGVQRLILGLAASPAGRAYRHSVLCLFGAKGNIKRQFEEAGLSYGFCGVPWPATLDLGSYRVSRWLRQGLSWTFPMRLARELEKRSADLVHTHVTYRMELQSEGIVRRARLPMVWTIHGQYRPEGRELDRWRHATRLAARHGAITAVAEDLARDFRDRGLDYPAGIAITRGGIDLSAFRSGSVERDPRRRAEWKIPADAVVFGAHGRLVPEKAYEVFVRAAARLVGDGVNAHFAIAGAGPLQDSLEAEIAAANLRERFHLVGFTEDVPAFLREIDVFVLSSRMEGFPIALVEALAAGLPAIATPAGGVPEMVGEEGALLIPAESEEALAEGMARLMSPTARAKYGAHGPRIAQRFSIDHMSEQFAAIYDGLLHPAATSLGSRKVKEQ
jgi:glycosyltransferase involved in cell wall biosynthesis